jgi:ABC-type Na+ efflux pump permease subunit
MRHILFIARTEIAYQLRQRETLLWVFVMPIIFFYFIGTITGGMGGGMGGGATGGPPQSITLESPPDAGFLVDHLVRRLEAQNFAVVRPESDEERERFSRHLIVDAPASGKTFTEAVLAGEAQTIRVESGADGNAASLEQLRIQRAVYTLLADLAVADEARVDAGGAAGGAAGGGVGAEAVGALDDNALTSVADAPRMVTLEVTSAGRRVTIPEGFEQTIPGTMVMFTMLVLLTGGAIQLVLEREQGLLRRLASTPISRAELVAGKWVGKLLLGLVQIAFAMVAGTVLFGMQWGSALPMVLVVMFCWAAFNASLGLLLGNIANSPAQMAGIGVLTTMVLAALGGCWWPIEVTPAWAQQFARLLPTGWAMGAMHKLISFGDGASAVLPHTAALVVSAAILGAISAKRFRYQ